MNIIHCQVVLYILTSFFEVNGQDDASAVYGKLNRDILINCPFRTTKTDTLSLIWIGPPYSSYSGTTYITSNDGANPNTVLGDRLKVTGDHTNGEYNLKILNLQQSDEGRYGCRYGNQRKYFDLQVVVSVTSVAISPDTITVIEGRSSLVTCTSSDSVPAAIVTWYVLRPGSSIPVQVTRGTNSTQHEKRTISTVLYTGKSLDNGVYLYCNATNAEQETEILSGNSSITVLYSPKVEPIVTGYIPGSVLYEGDSDLVLTCQQEGGNPLSTVTWLNSTNDDTDNSTSYISSSYITLPVNRKLNGYTYTCLVTYPGTHVDYRRNLSVTFSVLYLSISVESEKKAYDSTDDIQLQCMTNIQNQDITFSAWAHRVGSTLVRQVSGRTSNGVNSLQIPFAGYQDIGIYTCHGNNKNGRRMKSQDIQINVYDQPVFTDNITTTESNGKTEINVDYFSVPKPIKLEWLKDDNILYMSEKYIQNNILADISLTFHKVKVKLTGYRSTITIMAPDQKDYGNYVLRVQNAKETVLQKIPYFPTVSPANAHPNWTIIAVTIATILLIILIIGGVLFVVCIRRKRKESKPPQTAAECNIGDDKTSTYEDIGDPSDADRNTYEMQEPSKNTTGVYEELHHQNVIPDIYNSMVTT